MLITGLPPTLRMMGSPAAAQFVRPTGCVKRTGPGPCRPDRAGSRRWRVAERSTRRIGGYPGESAATNLPWSAQRRGLANSVWQATRWRAESRIEMVERGMLMQHVRKSGVLGLREALTAKRSWECREPSACVGVGGGPPARHKYRPESFPHSTCEK